MTNWRWTRSRTRVLVSTCWMRYQRPWSMLLCVAGAQPAVESRGTVDPRLVAQRRVNPCAVPLGVERRGVGHLPADGQVAWYQQLDALGVLGHTRAQHHGVEDADRVHEAAAGPGPIRHHRPEPELARPRPQPIARSQGSACTPGSQGDSGVIPRNLRTTARRAET